MGAVMCFLGFLRARGATEVQSSQSRNLAYTAVCRGRCSHLGDYARFANATNATAARRDVTLFAGTVRAASSHATASFRHLALQRREIDHSAPHDRHSVHLHA